MLIGEEIYAEFGLNLGRILLDLTWKRITINGPLIICEICVRLKEEVD